jgi:arylsulfatase A-like enzyme
MNRILLYILIFNTLAVQGQPTKPVKPNIIFILSDDVGYGDLSCYGASSVRTPAIDKLAANGIRFTHAYSCASTCTPSRYGLLTGHYPWRRNDTGIARGDAPMIIHPEQANL